MSAMFFFKSGLVVCLCIAMIQCHPTVYKFNENRALEPDLVPVSSTVIPLPVYQVVSSDLNFRPTSKDEKVKKPEGPVTLITVHSKKKPLPITKPKLSDVSVVKQVSKKDYEN